MKDRLQASDRRFLAIYLVLLTGTAWFSTRNLYCAFPKTSIDFRESRADAQIQAQQFLSRQDLASPRTGTLAASVSTTRRSWNAKPVWRRPASSSARTCGFGDGPSVGSGRYERRSSAPTSHPFANLQASTTNCRKMPHCPRSIPNKRAAWPGVFDARACIANQRRVRENLTSYTE